MAKRFFTLGCTVLTVMFYLGCKSDSGKADIDTSKPETESTLDSLVRDSGIVFSSSDTIIDSSKDAKPATSPKNTAPKKRLLPVITFDKSQYDFDTIVDGDVVEYFFEFTNTGNFDLVINGTDVTCGCTVPSYPFIPIKPGEKGKIGVRYNSVGKKGLQKAKVTVKTNAQPRNHVLYLSGFVKGRPKK